MTATGSSRDPLINMIGAMTVRQRCTLSPTFSSVSRNQNRRGPHKSFIRTSSAASNAYTLAEGSHPTRSRWGRGRCPAVPGTVTDPVSSFTRNDGQASLAHERNPHQFGIVRHVVDHDPVTDAGTPADWRRQQRFGRGHDAANLGNFALAQRADCGGFPRFDCSPQRNAAGLADFPPRPQHRHDEQEHHHHSP